MNNNYAKQSSKGFNSTDYPEMVDELARLAKRIRFMPGYDKVEATVSFLKDHSIKSEFVKSNPLLVSLIRSNSFQLLHIESLFELCRDNPSFLRDYEKYINQELS